MEVKHELHPDLHDASLEKACKIANGLTHTAHKSRTTVESDAADLHYMLEYLRLNFDLVPKGHHMGLQKSLDIESDRLAKIAKYVGATDYIDSIGPILDKIDEMLSHGRKLY